MSSISSVISSRLLFDSFRQFFNLQLLAVVFYFTIIGSCLLFHSYWQLSSIFFSCRLVSFILIGQLFDGKYWLSVGTNVTRTVKGRYLSTHVDLLMNCSKRPAESIEIHLGTTFKVTPSLDLLFYISQ